MEYKGFTAEWSDEKTLVIGGKGSLTAEIMEHLLEGKKERPSNIELKSGITRLEEDVFYGFNKPNIKFPRSLKKIDDYVFGYWQFGVKVKIPAGCVADKLACYHSDSVSPIYKYENTILRFVNACWTLVDGESEPVIMGYSREKLARFKKESKQVNDFEPDRHEWLIRDDHVVGFCIIIENSEMAGMSMHYDHAWYWRDVTRPEDDTTHGKIE